MKSFKAFNKNNKKGFTLVELIVVLVILAILAALLIPTLTGYIDKAKEKNVIAQTRSILSAVQTEVDDAYGTDSNHWIEGSKLFTFASKDGTYIDGVNNKVDSTTLVNSYQEITNLAEVSNLNNDNSYFLAVVSPQAKVHFIMYNDGKGHIGLYFNETQEYLVYKTSEVKREDNYSSFKNKVVVTPITDLDASITTSNMWRKNTILYFLGIKDDPLS